jgi:phosphomannomutase
MKLFSENDVRGIYPQQLNRDTVYRIGFYLPRLLETDDVLVGRDPRLSSEEIFDDLSRGIIDGGADVTDIGPCCTPSLYFANAYYGFAASVMITASHNPPEYNGLKVSGVGAVPVDRSTGLRKLEEMIKVAPRPAASKGRSRFLEFTDDYLRFLKPYKQGIAPLRLLSDCSNGAAAYRFGQLLAGLPVEHRILNGVPNGRFPRHGPNPLEAKNLIQIREEVMSETADLGVCFDGDGDRVVFIDEKGQPVPPDLITALLGLHFFKYHRDELQDPPTVLYDIRCSKSVAEYLRSLGARPLPCPVGHAAIKTMLRRERGLYAGELTGHYYFRDFFYCDSALMALLIVLGILSREKRRLSELVQPLRRYFSSGEISFAVENAKNRKRILEDVRQAYETGTVRDISALRVDFEHWWFVLRSGSTEPRIRLVVEADTEEELNRRKEELITRIVAVDEGAKNENEL